MPTWLKSAKAKSKKATWQEEKNDNLIPPWSTKGYLGGVWPVGTKCGNCSLFVNCEREKGVVENTEYCQYRISRFKHKDPLCQ